MRCNRSKIVFHCNICTDTHKLAIIRCFWLCFTQFLDSTDESTASETQNALKWLIRSQSQLMTNIQDMNRQSKSNMVELHGWLTILSAQDGYMLASAPGPSRLIQRSKVCDSFFLAYVMPQIREVSWFVLLDNDLENLLLRFASDKFTRFLTFYYLALTNINSNFFLFHRTLVCPPSAQPRNTYWSLYFSKHELDMHLDDLCFDIRKRAISFMGTVYDNLKKYCKNDLKLNESTKYEDAFVCFHEPTLEDTAAHIVSGLFFVLNTSVVLAVTCIFFIICRQRLTTPLFERSSKYCLNCLEMAKSEPPPKQQPFAGCVTCLLFIVFNDFTFIIAILLNL